MSGKNVKTWAAVCIATVMLGQSDTSAQEEIDWTGWYGGAFGSYISGTLNSNDPSHRQSTGDYDEDSPMAGVSISYLRQYPSDWVAGVELMVPLYMQKGTAVDKQFFPDIVTYEASYRYGVLLSAKGGKSYGSALPYAIGGIGLTNVVGKTFNVDLNDQVSMGFEQSAAATHFIW